MFNAPAGRGAAAGRAQPPGAASAPRQCIVTSKRPKLVSNGVGQENCRFQQGQKQHAHAWDPGGSTTYLARNDVEAVWLAFEKVWHTVTSNPE